MNQTATYRQISLIIGVIVALVIIFGMWLSSADASLSQIEHPQFTPGDFKITSLIKAAALRF